MYEYTHLRAKSGAASTWLQQSTAACSMSGIATCVCSVLHRVAAC